jgi:hypothetical protein
MRRHRSNLLRRVPKTKREAFWLLASIDDHFEHSGEKNRQAFIEPKKAQKKLREVVAELNGLWRRRRSDVHQPVLRIKRRPEVRHAENVQHLFPKPIAAQPVVFAQGFLRRRMTVGETDNSQNPLHCSATDTFLSGHKVIVYRNGRHRFDIVDALCKLPIVDNVTRRFIKMSVELSGEPPASDRELRIAHGRQSWLVAQGRKIRA